jgi:hypothetical protein
MIWLALLLWAVVMVVLIVVYACCRMAGMSDEEVQMYVDEQERQADYEYLLKQRSKITKQLN